MMYPARAAVFYTDVASWGGDLPWGVGSESLWDPSFKDSPGIGGTTPQSLFDRWAKKTGQPHNQNIGTGYAPVQVLIDAIERGAKENYNFGIKIFGWAEKQPSFERNRIFYGPRRKISPEGKQK